MRITATAARRWEMRQCPSQPCRLRSNGRCNQWPTVHTLPLTRAFRDKSSLISSTLTSCKIFKIWRTELPRSSSSINSRLLSPTIARHMRRKYPRSGTPPSSSKSNKYRISTSAKWSSNWSSSQLVLKTSSTPGTLRNRARKEPAQSCSQRSNRWHSLAKCPHLPTTRRITSRTQQLSIEKCPKSTHTSPSGTKTTKRRNF